ncbi:MAG: DNA cytosine methyltransferase, partial [Promethearchaeota archaeon]
IKNSVEHLPRDNKDDETFTVIDLFSGCGGFSQGFIKAGFEVIVASEIWEPAIESYKKNHPGAPVISGDITLPEMKKQLYNIVGDKKVNVIIGGPPCQGYSVAGNRNPEDPRGQLYLDFAEIIDQIQPDFFVMENVKGLLHMKHVSPNLSDEELQDFKEDCTKLQRYKDLKRYGAQRALSNDENSEFLELKNNLRRYKKDIDEKLVPLVDKIMKKFQSNNYKVKWKVLNAADYGVPQTRERIIFIGTKHENIDLSFPLETHSKTPNLSPQKKAKKWRDVEETLLKYETWQEEPHKNHIFTKHSEKFINKLKATAIGDNVYKNYSDAWWRLDPNKPARTVKENHGGVFVHYKFDRVLTPRELAALQSFDDNFEFKGTKSSILKQIGNAVPPMLAKVLANHLKCYLKQ